MATQGESSTPNPPEAQRQRTKPARLRRYEPTPVYALVERVKRQGVELQKVHGPWRWIRRPLRRLGRNAEKAILIVTNGVAELVVDTAQRAADLSGLLNWCGVDHLQPISNLRPPHEALAHD